MSSRGRALVVLAAVLVLGFLLGMISFRFWEKEFPGDRGRPESGRFEVGSVASERLAERLHLNAEQQAKLESILEDLRTQIRATRQKMGKEFDEVRARTNDRIAAILTPEQKEQFEQLLKDGEAHRGSGGRRGGRTDHQPERETGNPRGDAPARPEE